MNSSPLPTVLTIAGFDPSGGAGLQADIKTIHALGGYALSVATAITAQNSQGVQGVFEVSREAFAAQLNSLMEDYQISAIKIGMLADLDKIEVVRDFLDNQTGVPVVLDPVLISSSGMPLLKQDAVTTLRQELLPLATLVTPNIPEAAFLLQENHCPQQLCSENDWQAEDFTNMKIQNLLLKGGHLSGIDSIDYLLADLQDETKIIPFTKPRLSVQHSHGTGCTLSSAIASYLAKGFSLPQAVEFGKDYLHQALANSAQGQPAYQRQPPKNNKDRKGGLNHFWQNCD